MSYGTFSHFDRYLESFATLYYGSDDNPAGTVVIDFISLQCDLDFSARQLDQRLDAITRIPIIPIGTSSKTGSYNPYIVEWNICDVIYQKLKSRHALEFKGNYPEWITGFGSRCDRIVNDIIEGNIVLDTDTTNKGIGAPQKILQIGVANFFSNWDSGYYQASDKPKSFRFRIAGTTDGNDVGQAKFICSDDAGYSWGSIYYPTNTNWVDIASGLKIRWEPIVLTGTFKQLELNDEWQIQCIPFEIASINADSKFKTFGRG